MNKTKTPIVKRVALAAAMLVGCAAVAPAFAGHVNIGIGIGLPVGGYYAPAPVYYAPPPVVYAPPPPPVYYEPAPTVVVSPGYYQRVYYRHGEGYYRHHDRDDDDGYRHGHYRRYDGD